MNERTMIMREVARIAHVPDSHCARFLRVVDRAIDAAQKESPRTVSKSISGGVLTKDFFDPIGRAAKDLRVGLERLQGTAAAHFFSGELLPVSEPEDAADPIAHLLRSLNLGLVIEVAERASARAKRWLSKRGRKKGTGRPGFDRFVIAILAASEQTGGRLTIYKTSYEGGRWAGSLLKTLQQLRPLLPKTKFFPAGTLGYSLHTIYQRWRWETGKSRRTRR